MINKVMPIFGRRLSASIVFPAWEDNNIDGSVFLSALSGYTRGKTFSQTINTFGSLAGSIKWSGGVLAPNGKIYGIPRNSSTVLEIGLDQTILEDMVLSRYLNKL